MDTIIVNYCLHYSLKKYVYVTNIFFFKRFSEQIHYNGLDRVQLAPNGKKHFETERYYLNLSNNNPGFWFSIAKRFVTMCPTRHNPGNQIS